MAISDLACFILEGSLCPAPYAIIPNYISPSFRYLEKEEGGSIILTGFPSYHPTIDPNTGSFLLQPPSVNLLTYNVDIGKNVWQKGSKVFVSNNISDVKCPDGTMSADIISWASGQGATQLFQRDIAVDESSTYTFSAFLMLRGGKFGANDVMSISGSNVASVQSYKLAALNDHSNLWRIVELTFTTAGNNPVIPVDNTIKSYSISTVTSNSLTLTASPDVAADSLKDLVVDFVDDLQQNRKYVITSNTESDTLGNVTITLDKNTLITDSVTTSLKARLSSPPPFNVTIQMYSENNVSLVWGGAQLEKKDFRTGIIYQLAEIQSRAGDSLEYTESPIKNLSTFSVYLDIEEWRGSGNVIDIGNLKASLEKGKLKVQAGNIIAITQDDLPKSAKVLIQVSRELSSLCVFVNNVLKAKESLASFKASDSILKLTSEGYRLYRRIIIFNNLLKDGQPSLGQSGSLDVAEVFTNQNLIPPSTINIINPLLLLPTMSVSAATKPAASTDITAINTGTKVITVTDGTNFPTSGLAKITRNNSFIAWVLITAKTSNSITLDNVTSIQVGDFLVGTQSDSPGYSSIRFPCRYDDLQLISAIDTVNNTVTLTSTLSFSRGSKAVVISDSFQDVAEITITSIDNVTSKLTLSSTTGISVGNYIYQPLVGREMIIPPTLYIPFIMNDMDGVRIAIAGQNGVVVENNWDKPMTVTVGIRYAG